MHIKGTSPFYFLNIVFPYYSNTWRIVLHFTKSFVIKNGRLRFKPLCQNGFKFIVIKNAVPKQLLNCSEQMKIRRSHVRVAGKVLNHVPFQFVQNLSCSYISVMVRVIVYEHIPKKIGYDVCSGQLFQLYQCPTINFGTDCCSMSRGFNQQVSMDIPKDVKHHLPRWG